MDRPSARFVSFFVRTTTARRISPLRTLLDASKFDDDDDGPDEFCGMGRARLITHTISSPFHSRCTISVTHFCMHAFLHRKNALTDSGMSLSTFELENVDALRDQPARIVNNHLLMKKKDMKGSDSMLRLL
jgi:hypothetical protein